MAIESDLIDDPVTFAGGDLQLLRPREGAELPDDSGVEWAPLLPYWSVLWRSGVALGHELSSQRLEGARVVELGCGLGVPSLIASRAGAVVLATDEADDALELLERNASRNGLTLEVARVDWASPAKLLARAPFDLVLAADVLYEPASARQLLALLPRLAPRALLADPGRDSAEAFLTEARRRWSVTTSTRGVVSIHTLE